MPIYPVPRYAAIDMLRGLAMVWMTLFHFCFDLQHFGYLQANFYDDPFWTLQRTAIVSLFVFCAGLGQALALQQGQSWGRFWRRWRQIALCALAVSAGSYFMFPTSYISFGILHSMAAMLLLLRMGLRTAGAVPEPRAQAVRRRHRAWLLWPLGALALALPWLALQLHAASLSLDFLNARSWNWLGLISRKPITEDYAPLFPWLGVMCWGVATGQWLLQRHAHALERLSLALVQGAVGLPWRGLAWLGRWSLSYYMLHQPLLLGVFMGVGLLR
jgi:uncharacterized membrane protein